jgi:hypothetical protein
MVDPAQTTPLETTRVREVVGVVDRREALDTLVEQLLLAGVDRSRISLMASREAILHKLNHYYMEPTVLAEVPGLPRRDLVTRDDETGLTALLFGTLLSVVVLGAGVTVVASGGALAAALAAAGVGGALATSVAHVLKHRVIGESDPDAIEMDLMAGGLLVFVRLPTLADEGKVEAIVREHARNVHVHEIELPKTLLDIPLGQINPDPWLVGSPLGAP